MIYQAIVESVMTFALPLWGGQLDGPRIAKLHSRVLNPACRIILGVELRGRLEALHLLAGLSSFPQLVSQRCAALVERGSRGTDNEGLTIALRHRFAGDVASSVEPEHLAPISLDEAQLAGVATSLAAHRAAVEVKRMRVGSPPCEAPAFVLPSTLRVFYRDAGPRAGASLGPVSVWVPESVSDGASGGYLTPTRRIWQSCERTTQLPALVGSDW